MLGSGQSRSSDSSHRAQSNRSSGNSDSVKSDNNEHYSKHHRHHHRHHHHNSERDVTNGGSRNVTESGSGSSHSSNIVELLSDSDDGRRKKRREEDEHKRSNKVRRDSIPLYRHHRERRDVREHARRVDREESDREDGERSRDTSPGTPINDTAPEGKKELLLRKLEQERSLRSSLERGVNSASPSLSPSHNILVSSSRSRSPIQQKPLQVLPVKPSYSNEKQHLSSSSRSEPGFIASSLTTNNASQSPLEDEEEEQNSSPSPKSPTPIQLSPKPSPPSRSSSSRSPSPAQQTHETTHSDRKLSRSSSRSQPRDSPPSQPIAASSFSPLPSTRRSASRSRSRSPPALSPLSPVPSRSPEVSPQQSVLNLTPPSPSFRKRKREAVVDDSSLPPAGSESAKDSPPLDHSPLINSPKVDRESSSPKEEPPSPHLQLSESDEEENKVKVHVSDSESGKLQEQAVESDDDNDQILYHFPPIMGCRSVNCYRRKNKIDEGMYGVVFRAEDKITGEIVALKKIKMQDDHGGSLGGFPVTSLREINILRALDHPNIVSIKEIVTGDKAENIFMVMEYMDHDLKMLMRSLSTPFSQAEVKCLIKQLLEATACMHENWILHRDLKTSNLLLNNKGILKVCDFGMARSYGSPLGNYTSLVVTLWYRAPELLLGSLKYSSAVDMWSVGCIFAEFLLKEPILAGKSELLQLTKIFKLLGTPTPKQWPGMQDLPLFKTFTLPKFGRSQLRDKFPRASYHGGVYLSDLGFDLLEKMLTYDPAKRISAADALKHPYFKEFPLAQDPSMMRAFPSLNEDGVSRANRHRLKSGIDPHVIRDEMEQQKAQNGFFLRDS